MSADRDEDKTPAEIEAEIADTREDLGDTVAAVADKGDIKKQAKKKTGKKADEVKAKATEVKDATAAKLDDVKASVSSKVDEAGDKVAEKADDLQETNPTPGGREGSAGDIGSGPTGDIRENPEVADTGKGLTDNPVVLVAAAFVVGFAIGRLTGR